MRNILLYRYIVLNSILGTWLFMTETYNGWFSKMVTADTTYISHGICALFVAVFFMSMLAVFKTNREANDHMDFRGPLTGDVRVTNLEWIERAGMWMLMLGLIGTIRGLQISLEGVNTGNLASLDGVKALAVQMISGLRIEITTTLLGSGAFLWTEFNYALVKHEASKLAYKEERAK